MADVRTLETIDQDTLAKIDTEAWIAKEKVVNESEKPMDFEQFYFLKDIYRCRTKKKAVKKSGQSGVSTFAILYGHHRARYHGVNVIHTLPADADVLKFVPSKVDQIVRYNKSLSSKMAKGDAESMSKKQYGKGFVFYLGTISKRAGIMISSDINIYDEYDFSDINKVEKYKSRQEAPDSLKEEIWISTPTTPAFGISRKYDESDQRNLRWNCPHCGHRQHFEWPESVDFEGKRYRCKKCDGTIDNTKFPELQNKLDIRWEAKYPDLSDELAGWWINQMMVPYKTANDLIKEYEKAEKEGNLEYFYNYNLGMAYMSTDTEMNEGLVYKNLTDKEYIETDSCAGVDVQGNELYVIIGNEQAIYGIAQVPDLPNKTKWERLAELLEVYGIRYMVIDAGFKPNDVVDFAKQFPYRVYTAWYQPDPKGAKIFRFYKKKFTDKKEVPFEEEVKVLIDREKAIDLAIEKLAKGKRKFPYVKTDENLQNFIKHMKTMYARIVGTKMGEERREWASTGKHDYVMALVYFEAALHKKTLYENS